MPVTAIEDSVRISNNFLYLIAGFTILIGGIIILVVSRKFTEPILELNDIAKKMSKLDFSQKYRITDADDEINNLGKSINIMSDKLEKTIKQLRNTNMELEKDIEEKSKIDEMRKSFISDVSHELKTPIALIQGYSEGLIENVNTDESRKFYAEVIQDEINKMDKLVKQLLELMKLEYGKREFNNKVFDIVELESEVLRKSKVMLEEKNIKVEFENSGEIDVFADDFCSNDRIIVGDCDSGGVFQNTGDFLVWSIFQCQTEHGVFNNTVLNASFTQFLTHLGIISNADAVVSNDNASQRTSDLGVQFCNISLLGFQNLCTGHLFSPHSACKIYRQAALSKEKATFPLPGKWL